MSKCVPKNKRYNTVYSSPTAPLKQPLGLLVSESVALDYHPMDRQSNGCYKIRVPDVDKVYNGASSLYTDNYDYDSNERNYYD